MELGDGSNVSFGIRDNLAVVQRETSIVIFLQIHFLIVNLQEVRLRCIERVLNVIK